jgi:hypothetical protein
MMAPSYLEVGASDKPGAVHSDAICTRQTAMRILAVNKKTLSHLVEIGALAETQLKANLKPICRLSLTAFCARWVKAGELAARTGSSKMLIQRVLRSRAITVLSEKGLTNPEITCFFDRAQCDALDFNTLLDSVAVHRNKKWSEYAFGLGQRNASRVAQQ